MYLFILLKQIESSEDNTEIGNELAFKASFVITLRIEN